MVTKRDLVAVTLAAAAAGFGLPGTNDANAQTPCPTCTGGTAAQAQANPVINNNTGSGSGSRFGVFLGGGSVAAAPLPSNGGFWGALLNSCLRSQAFGALGFGYADSNRSRFDKPDENGEGGEVSACIQDAIKQYNQEQRNNTHLELLRDSDPAKAATGLNAVAQGDPAVKKALDEVKTAWEECNSKGGNLNAIGGCVIPKQQIAYAPVVSQGQSAAPASAPVQPKAKASKPKPLTDFQKCMRDAVKASRSNAAAMCEARTSQGAAAPGARR